MGIDAPREIPVHRKEIYDRIILENTLKLAEELQKKQNKEVIEEAKSA